MLLNTNLATKADLAQVEATLRAEIAQARQEMTKWMFGIVLGVAALQTTLILGLLS